jgi:hypothetical protein
MIYVDESGDPGLINSPSRYFILSGLVAHELRWQECLKQLYDFRKKVAQRFGLRVREEIHAADLINRPGKLQRIHKADRLAILRLFLKEIASLPEVSAINVIVDKQGKPPDTDVFEVAWQALIQRFENTISKRNFPGPKNSDERGIIFSDETDVKKLRSLLRRMRYFNYIPNQPGYGKGARNIPVKYVIEDPVHRRSHDSFLVQVADAMAYALLQHERPCGYMRKKGGYRYFELLQPILCTVAAASDPLGIVRR